MTINDVKQMTTNDYKFTGEVKQQVESFKSHLQKQRIDKNTLRQKTNYAGYYLNWLESEHLQAIDTRYNDLLNFVDYCRLEGKTRHHINTMLRAVRNYYEFLKLTNPGLTNPAKNLHIKGTRQKVISGVTPMEELEKLYNEYPVNTNRSKRNKIILGLFIYQGITTEELSRLEPNHLKLKAGKIYIPGNRRRNSRTLELKPFQILELHEYLTEIRPKILAEIPKSKPCRKPDKINKTRIKDQLFISINGSEHIKNSLLHLFRDVKKINPGIINAVQIRQSVITYWLKNHNLRQVQYMAGHKYVSSTERYQTSNLENLQNKLEKYHPLKW
jgi:integrase/recombinase XerD